MANSLLNPLPVFDPTSDPTSLSQQWQAWKRRFETYLTALGITDGKQKRALLLYQAGLETHDIFDTFSETGGESDYDIALKKMDEYFAPKKNVDYEIVQFRQAHQLAGEKSLKKTRNSL